MRQRQKGVRIATYPNIPIYAFNSNMLKDSSNMIHETVKTMLEKMIAVEAKRIQLIQPLNDETEAEFLKRVLNTFSCSLYYYIYYDPNSQMVRLNLEELQNLLSELLDLNSCVDIDDLISTSRDT